MPVAAGTVQQTVIPATAADGVTKALWAGRYGEHVVSQIAAARGVVLQPVLYRGTTPTWGTGVAISDAARTAFSATQCTTLFRNTAGAGGKYVVPLWVRLVVTAAGTAGTNAHLGLIVDTTNRYSSGGTTITGVTGVNSAKSDASDTAVCTAYAGAITAAAASAPRQMGRAAVITRAAATAFVVGDEVLITFGDVAGNPGQTVVSTTAARYTVEFGAVALAPGHSALIHFWSAAQTAAPSAEYEVAWMEL